VQDYREFVEEMTELELAQEGRLEGKLDRQRLHQLRKRFQDLRRVISPEQARVVEQRFERLGGVI
jgi:hypothetical protein